MPPLVPAELTFAGDGTPFAPAYGDVYHPVAGGLAQARHVFLAGNGLLGDDTRWAGRRRFTVLETGFGLGLNFLATLQRWRERPGAGRLHYAAVEKHPFRAADLARAHAAWPELASLAEALRAQWPPLLPGLHRLDFGDVSLTLAFGDANEFLPQLTLAADAIYLDGFAPDRNPDLWGEAVVTQVRRLAAPGASLATWTVAGDVRRRLAAAGFVLERRPGFGTKREMLAGTLPGAVESSALQPRRIAVVGAGIAGAAAAHALARRGHAVTVLEAAPGPAAGASGNRAGVFRPLPSLDDSPLARILRAGFLLGRRRFAALDAARCGWTGVLHVARDASHEATQRRVVAEQALPVEFCRYVDREEATRLAGWPVALGGWWFAGGGWIDPPSLCRALLAGIDCRCNAAVTRIERAPAGWRLEAGGESVAADDVVLANGIDAPVLATGHMLPLRAGRGVVSHLPAAATPPFDIVATRLGYVTPAVDGVRCAGATMAIDDAGLEPRTADHAENLGRLDMVLPGFAAGIDPASLDGRVGVRPMSPDRLPMVGPLSASEGTWVIDGFGARGLVFAAICAELLADQVSGDPLPLERDLVAALDPARFARRARRTRNQM